MAIQLRPEAISLACLRSWADEWDHEGDGACWPAGRFVEWVTRNLERPGNEERAKVLREVGQQNRHSARKGVGASG